MFCRFAGIGVGHKIQYPTTTSFSASDEHNEVGDGEQESINEFGSDYTSTSRCSTNIAAQARSNCSDSDEEDAYGTASETDSCEDEFEHSEAGQEDGEDSNSDGEDIRF